MSKSKAARRQEAEELMNALPAFGRGAVSFAAGIAENDNRLGAIADRIGKVAALQAELAVYGDKLKDVLVTSGEDAVEGKLFRATISRYDQNRLDTKRLREEQPKLAEKYALPPTPVTQVRVKARTGALVDA
jgi:hypothetical protein